MLLLDIFISFSKVGIFAYGGGPSMIPLVQEEVVDVHGWMTIEEFTDALAMGYALPGPIATKMAAYIGYKVAHGPGLLVALFGTVFPSLINDDGSGRLLLELQRFPLRPSHPQGCQTGRCGTPFRRRMGNVPKVSDILAHWADCRYHLCSHQPAQCPSCRGDRRIRRCRHRPLPLTC